ncbi:integrase core domain-containing protein [Streptosporangium sp. LJ11]|uniref:integrase core domain-containing protein n=1 Tax=Streptosporangium sp. LJ11 TaxID=3436927 RepID=UPI003F7A20A2
MGNPAHVGYRSGARRSGPTWRQFLTAICERVIGTLRRELLDRILILNESHLARMLQEYLIHYNEHRPHQSRHQRPPNTGTQPTRDTTDLLGLRSIRRKLVVASTISEHHHVAQPQLRARNSIFERHTLRPRPAIRR